VKRRQVDSSRPAYLRICHHPPDPLVALREVVKPEVLILLIGLRLRAPDWPVLVVLLRAEGVGPSWAGRAEGSALLCSTHAPRTTRTRGASGSTAPRLPQGALAREHEQRSRALGRRDRHLAAGAPCLSEPAFDIPASILGLAALPPARTAAPIPAPPPARPAAAVPAALPPRPADSIALDAPPLCPAAPDNTRGVSSADFPARDTDGVGGGTGRGGYARDAAGARTRYAEDCRRRAATCRRARNMSPSAPAAPTAPAARVPRVPRRAPRARTPANYGGREAGRHKHTARSTGAGERGGTHARAGTRTRAGMRACHRTHPVCSGLPPPPRRDMAGLCADGRASAPKQGRLGGQNFLFFGWQNVVLCEALVQIFESRVLGWGED